VKERPHPEIMLCKLRYCLMMAEQFSRHIFEKHSNINFHENPSSGNQVVPRERTHTDGQTDRRKEAET
jgi:hypothetical protein